MKFPDARGRALLVAPLVVLACNAAPPDRARVDVATVKREVTGAMERYMVAARAVDAEAIAGFYSPTAMLFEPGIEPIETRERIRAFMASFPGVRVDVATATPDTIEVFDGTVYFWGSYFERLAFPGQPVSEQHGRFVMEWTRQSDGAWLIQRYFRVPVPGPLPPDTTRP
jgi:ketosteroid isomerase-like protein